MNTSNSTTEDLSELYSAVVFGCIMLIGLPLNAASLWILLRHHSLKSPNSIFMVNLAISDLLLVISLPARVYFHATGTWPLSIMACLFITMLFRNNIRSSAIFITFISVDRLLAVVYPLRSRHLRTSTNAWKGVVLVWLMLFIVHIPESVDFSKYLESQSEPTCFGSHEQSRSPTRSAIIYFQILLLSTMLAVNIVCTVMVSWTLHSHLSTSARVNNKVNVMLIFAMNLILFTICFLPVPLYLVTKSKISVTPLMCLTAVNCCLDPLLYYFSFDGFWKKKDNEVPTGEL